MSTYPHYPKYIIHPILNTVLSSPNGLMIFSEAERVFNIDSDVGKVNYIGSEADYGCHQIVISAHNLAPLVGADAKWDEKVTQVTLPTSKPGLLNLFFQKMVVYIAKEFEQVNQTEIIEKCQTQESWIDNVLSADMTTILIAVVIGVAIIILIIIIIAIVK